LPHQLPAGLRAWLVRALRGGTVSDARVTVKGDLAEFPFAGGKGGQFLVSAKVQGAGLDYAQSWPPLADIDADVRFEGARMSVAATRGRALGAALGNTTAEIPDLRAPHPELRVEGEASGPTGEFLAFIGSSPVAGWIDRATDGLEATGNGRLALRLEMGLPDPAPRVTGEYALVNNQLRLHGVPQLSQVNGKLQFSERDVRANDISLELVGGPARANLATVEGRVNVAATGTAGLAQLRNELKSPLLDHVTGTTDWRLALVARPGFASWVVESSLRGAAIDLPAPFGKAADATVPLRIERLALANTTARDEIRVDYGTMARVVAQRRLHEGDPVTDRALVLLGRAMERGGEPERPGITVRGDMATVNADEWFWLLQQAGKRDVAAGAGALEIAALDLQAAQFDVLGRGFHDMVLGARRSGDDWRLTIASREVEGTATWEPGGQRHANGRVVARLARLALPGPGEIKPWPGAPQGRTPRAEGIANPWPEIDILADRYQAKRGDLGRLELVAKPYGSDWRIEKLALGNDAGTISADGWWRSRGREQQTRLDVALDVKDAAAYLARFGLPDAVRGAPTKIEGQLAWNGSPDDFDYPTLNGTFKVNVGAGQFTKIEPGIGKLLGVLSLQALPRRITLDFRDIFSEGFAFDSIAGDVRIASGTMHSDELVLSGPAARVLIAGDVDIERETQRLVVRVQPSLATSVSAGAALLLIAANPVVAAAVGAGTLLAQKMMKDPIEQIFTYEYAVKGSWAEPLVERIGARAPDTAGDAGKATAATRSQPQN
jgi:uncharacterized protein (TIGR02099 family)